MKILSLFIVKIFNKKIKSYSVMKKIFTLGLLLFAIHFLNANPIPTPNDFVLSELYFNSEGKWTMEVKFVGDSFYGTEDIYIITASGISQLKRLSYESIFQKNMILTITNDSLMSDLTINSLGDNIYISREYVVSLVPPLVFGNLVQASVRAPENGESIALYGYDYQYDFDYDYSIDKSPSIGYENDSTGMLGTIKGQIYDPYNLLPSNVWLSGNGIIDFKPDVNGNYSTRITSSKHNIDKLYYFETNKKSPGYYLKVVPVVVTTEPDTVVNVDFHIYDIVSAVENIKNTQESIFKISPNSINELSFNYEITIPVKSTNSFIEIINISGQVMGRFSINESSGRIYLPEKLQAGNYTVRLFVNNKNYANSKIIIAY